jgi:hypothetical protein
MMMMMLLSLLEETKKIVFRGRWGRCPQFWSIVKLYYVVQYDDLNG